MERELCLILDKDGYYRLVLKSGTSFEIDDYTTKFEDSDGIRKKHKKEINDFLQKYSDTIKNSNNPNYEGRIAVVIPKKIGMDITEYQKKVLYKKHIIAFEYFINDKTYLIDLVKYERSLRKDDKLVSDYISRIIFSRYVKNNTIIREFKKYLKEEKNRKIAYYDLVRDALACYNQSREYRPFLPSIDKIYEKYLKEKEEKIKNKINGIKNIKLQKNVVHEIVPDSIEKKENFKVGDTVYDIDELHLLDLDDIEVGNSDYVPDGKRYE